MFLGIPLGILLVGIILWDTFETIVLPRTVTRSWRFTVFFFRIFWVVWQGLIRPVKKQRHREALLSAFGPLSLLMLLVVWAVCLIFGFALIQWGMGSHTFSDHAGKSLMTDLYMSGTTFFTLGYGDVVPDSPAARVVAVFEAGVGFGFLAIVIGYLPVLYQSFSRREAGISLMDARAGSSPTPAEMLRRHAEAGVISSLTMQLHEWEIWASDMMESTLSYPVLAFYRSQHDRESWLSSLITILDTCALIRVCLETEDTSGKQEPDWHKPLRWQAHLTFAMARQATIDIALILKCPPAHCPMDRLPATDLQRIADQLQVHGIEVCTTPAHDERLRRIRNEYEPYVYALAERLMLTIPDWLPEKDTKGDNWQRSAWDHHDHFG